MASTANRHWGTIEAPSEARSDGLSRGGEGCSSPSPNMGVRGIASGKILNCNMQICAVWWCIFASTITANYMHSQHAIYNNENNYDKLWGYKIFRPRLTKYCRDASPASPVALTPLFTQSSQCLQLQCSYLNAVAAAAWWVDGQKDTRVVMGVSINLFTCARDFIQYDRLWRNILSTTVTGSNKNNTC